MKISELLDKPEKWTKGSFAKTVDEIPTLSSSPTAVCWCIIGAIRKCYRDCITTELQVVKLVREKLIEIGDLGDITAWNDSPERTYEDIITLAKKLDI